MTMMVCSNNNSSSIDATVSMQHQVQQHFQQTLPTENMVSLRHNDTNRANEPSSMYGQNQTLLVPSSTSFAGSDESAVKRNLQPQTLPSFSEMLKTKEGAFVGGTAMSCTTTSTNVVSNGKALDLLFGASPSQQGATFQQARYVPSGVTYSPPPPPYYHHVHASQTSLHGGHQLGWKGGSGLACGAMMRRPGEDATATIEQLKDGFHSIAAAPSTHSSFNTNSMLNESYQHHRSVVVAPNTSTSSPSLPSNAFSHHQQQHLQTPFDYQNTNITRYCYHETPPTEPCQCHLQFTSKVQMNQFEMSTYPLMQHPVHKKQKMDTNYPPLESHSIHNRSGPLGQISEPSGTSSESYSQKSSRDQSPARLHDSERQRIESSSNRRQSIVISQKKDVSSNASTASCDSTNQFKSAVSSESKKKTTKKVTSKAPVKCNYDLSKESFDDTKILPIRILAFNLGLSKDIQKSWRYRDIRRALFERMSADHTDFVDKQEEHSLLRERLPHKLNYSNFCKRAMLLVFHFIVRDGKEPKFFRRPLVQRDYIEKILKEHDPHFFSLINPNIAHELHKQITNEGKPFKEAVSIAFKDLLNTNWVSLHAPNKNSERGNRKTKKSPKKSPNTSSSSSEDEERDNDDISVGKPSKSGSGVARPKRNVSTKRKVENYDFSESEESNDHDQYEDDDSSYEEY